MNEGESVWKDLFAMLYCSKIYNVIFSKVKLVNISSGMRDMASESNTFEKNSARRTF